MIDRVAIRPQAALGPGQRRVKRTLDVILGAALLLLLSSLMLLVALWIKLDSPGPVFFIQPRVGEGGRLFRMIKFRSMVAGAEQGEAGRRFAKHPHDVRVTRAGRFLRRTSLDELPQLLNVLRGQMSLVGPRPELPQLVAAYGPRQRQRLAVPQGMTGWWQINGRMKRAQPGQRLADDLYYIHHYSLVLDVQILARTVLAVIHGEGAY